MPSTTDNTGETGPTNNTNPTGLIATTHEKRQMAEKRLSVGPVVGAIVAFAVLAVLIFVALRWRSSQKHSSDCRDVTIPESSAQLADFSKGKLVVVWCCV